jgi:dienelactone hydrolase
MNAFREGMMTGLREESVETPIHGRILIRDGDPRRLLVGFHGYAENADRHMAELLRLPGVEGWTVAAIQALHRFYNTRTQEVIASWMTRQNREELLADNIEYVRRAVASLGRPETLVFAGFSQGAAMAYRAAAAIRCDALLVHGGDLPEDVIAQQDVHLPLTLVARGKADDWFTAEKLERDVAVLQRVAKELKTLEFDGGHEWSDAFRQAAGQVLRGLA